MRHQILILISDVYISHPKRYAKFPLLVLQMPKLLENFQWSSSEEAVAKRESNIKEELADVLIYSVLFAEAVGLDLDEIIMEKLVINGNKYPAQAIHRIDYETSGLVLFCKHPFFQAYCDKNMEEHHIKKDYIALVQGHTNYKNKKIVSNIARDRHNAKKMIVHPNGKESISIFNTLKNYEDYSLIQVTILTGRKHQIRVQCASLKHPILNDSLYGGKRIDNTGLLLQSHHIQFNDIDVICPQEKRFIRK